MLKNRSSEVLPEIGLDTVKAMEVEVIDLLRSGSAVTVVAMANALAGSHKVMQRHGNVDSPDVLGRITSSFRSLGLGRSKSAGESLTRRYELINALNLLEKRPESSLKRISSWSEAREALSSVIKFPDEDYVPKEQKAEEDEDSIKSYFLKLESATQKVGIDDLTPSTTKWKQISMFPHPTKVGKGLQGQESTLKYRESAFDKTDEEFFLRLGHEYESQKARLEGGSVKDIERRLLDQEREAEAQKLAASLMRPLTDSEREAVKTAMFGIGPADEVIAVSGTDSVQRGSIQTLQPGSWLNDEVIHYFYEMLKKRDEEMCKQDPSRKRSHFFKSFFMTKLLNEGNSNPALDGKYDYGNVKRWSKQVPGKDLFKLDKIFFPINENRMHWVCAVAFMSEKRIQMYDSMGTDGMNYVESIFQYIQDEHKAKKGSPLPDADKWKLVPCQDDTPRQRNGK